MRSALRTLSLFVFIVLLAHGAASAQTSPTLDRIRSSQTIRIAYRVDAPPFSVKNSLGEPSGFIIDLCKIVADQVRQQLNLPSISITYVPVTAADRFDAISQGRADLLCGNTTATLSRSEVVDFSIPTFVDGASLLVRGDGPKDLQALAGQQIAVPAGTTTEDALRNTLAAAKVQANVILVRGYAEGLAMLDDGKVSALFGDRSVLMYVATQSKAPSKLALAENYLTVEPYALGLKHGDDDFRLAVNRALSHIYRSDTIRQLLANTFGTQAKIGGYIQALYVIAAYPD